jgi:hypothetical protein
VCATMMLLRLIFVIMIAQAIDISISLLILQRLLIGYD